MSKYATQTAACHARFAVCWWEEEEEEERCQGAERGRQRGLGVKVVHSTLPGSVCLPEQHSPTAQPRKRRRRRKKKRWRERERRWDTWEGKLKEEIQDKGRDRITGWAVYWNRYRDANKRHLKCFIEEIIQNRLLITWHFSRGKKEKKTGCDTVNHTHKHTWTHNEKKHRQQKQELKMSSWIWAHCIFW